MVNTTTFSIDNLSYFTFMLFEDLVFMFFILKLHKTHNMKLQGLHYLGIGMFNAAQLFLGLFDSSIYYTITLGFVLYPVVMKLITKKPFYVAIVEYLYLQFFNFTGVLVYAIIMYAIFTEATLRTMDTVIFLAGYFFTFIVLNYVSYLTLGKKIFSLISFIEKTYSTNSRLFYTGATLCLIWISLFFSLSHALRELYELNHNIDVFFWVFTVIVILIISLFSIMFILDQKMRFQTLTQKAAIDKLTGAMSPLFGSDYLSSIIDNPRIQKFSLVFIDVDNLKMVNDSLGHEVGNIYLRFIVDSFRDSITGDDTLIRHGGDEFLLILYDKNKDQADQLLSQIQSNINEDAPTELKHLSIGFSYGISIFDRESSDTNITELIEKADQNMYLNKRIRKTKSFETGY